MIIKAWGFHWFGLLQKCILNVRISQKHLANQIKEGHASSQSNYIIQPIVLHHNNEVIATAHPWLWTV